MWIAIEGYPYYAGELVFKQRVNTEKVPDAPEFFVGLDHLDANMHDCIELIINGHSLGVRPWAPYYWKASKNIFEKSENEIEVKIVNTLVGMLDGKFFDYTKHQLVAILGEKNDRT